MRMRVEGVRKNLNEVTDRMLVTMIIGWRPGRVLRKHLFHPFIWQSRKLSPERFPCSR